MNIARTFSLILAGLALSSGVARAGSVCEIDVLAPVISDKTLEMIDKSIKDRKCVEGDILVLNEYESKDISYISRLYCSFDKTIQLLGRGSVVICVYIGQRRDER